MTRPCSHPTEHQQVLRFMTRSSRRSAHACLACRMRKVRCDVVERHPCGNCKWAKCDCIILPRGHGRRLLREHAENPSSVTQLPSPHRDEPAPVACFSPSPLTHASPAIHPKVQLEQFIKPMPTQIPLDDLSYLISKGCLTLPVLDLQNALLRSYFEYTHPYMPILDIARFSKTVGSHDGRHGQISLLLYQAVMFAGTAHVPMKCLEVSGFQSRKQARKELFHRVRLLYDSNLEADEIKLVQAAILMTLYYDSTEGHRNAWHWKEFAISQAFSAGLHLEPQDMRLSDRTCKLRRKIWWSCYVRDRVISLMMKRPPRIRGDDFRVRMLDDDDFEMPWLDEGHDNLSEELCPYFWDQQKHEELGKLFIALVRLCRHLDPYLMSHRSIDEVDTQAISYRFVTNHQSNDTSNRQTPFASLNQELKAWQNALPECCQFKSPSDPARSAKSRILVQRISLHLFYQSILLAVHRSSCFLLSRTTPSPLWQETSRLCMHNAAFQISWMAGEIRQIGFDHLIPTSALVAVIPAAAIHLQLIRGRVSTDKDSVYQGFRQCLEVLNTLQDDYEPAMLARNAMSSEFDQFPSQEAHKQGRDDENPNVGDGEVIRLGIPLFDALSEDDLSLSPHVEDTAEPQLFEVMLQNSWFGFGIEGLGAIPELAEVLHCGFPNA